MAISPHLHLHFHARNSCNDWECCRKTPQEGDTDDLRLVQTAPDTLAPEKEAQGCWSAFKRAICCVHLPAPKTEEEKNADAVSLYNQYLLQQYGPLIVRAAPKLADVNLQEKSERQEALLVGEARAIVEKANLIQQHEKELGMMITQMKTYGIAQEIKKTPDRLPSPLSARRAAIEIKAGSDLEDQHVVKPDGQVERFRSKKVKRTITQVPVQEPLSKEQVQVLVERVQAAVIELGNQEIPVASIRQLIVREILAEGIEIVLPAFLGYVADAGMKLQLENKPSGEELSGEEYAALLTTIGNSPGHGGIEIDRVD